MESPRLSHNYVQSSLESSLVTGVDAVAAHSSEEQGLALTPSMPMDVDFAEKLAQHLRELQEIKDQWKFSIPWSNSVGINPNAIHAPLKRKATLTDESRLKRTKLSKDPEVSTSAYMAVSHMSSKMRGKLPASPTKSHSQIETVVSDTDTSDSADEPIAPAPSEEDEENKLGAFVRCRWDKCGKMVKRARCDQHLAACHKGKLGDTHGNRPCQWTGCGKQIESYQSMVRHLRTVHYVRRVWTCGGCGKSFTRGDAYKRHVDDSCTA
ncbi:hypothetical protein OH77DRAFT_1521971 [Trametes cingulata]|nr:hypothetical protein OH77DRAFT_1521971 [Trametes cingulata]